MWQRLQRSIVSVRGRSDVGRRGKMTSFWRNGRATGVICVLVALSIVAQLVFSFRSLPRNLHLQQRCRMSRMWPSYVRHDPPSSVGLNAKYRLFLYRELPPGEHQTPPHGRPALFVPGNAGSYGQVRSVASSAHHLHAQGEALDGVEVDWWTVDFNEDFSAFHGETMHEQALYLNDVIAYLRTVYTHNVKVPILAHSMGGIAARLMLQQHNYLNNSVETIVTLSSPHAYPPVPVDGGLESIYAQIEEAAKDEAVTKNVLLISLSGGALDDQLSSEGSALQLSGLWRSKSSLHAFTSSLAALWSGVDHLAMMWCDQLRERIARGVLRIEGQGAHVEVRREQWRRMLGMDRDVDLFDSPLTLDTVFEASAITPIDGLERTTIPVPAQLDFELLTDMPVGLDVSFGPPVDQEAQLRIALCTDASQCRNVKPAAFDVLPPSKPTSMSSSVNDFPVFPIASERYDLPGHALRRLLIGKGEMKKHGITSIVLERKSEATGFAYQRFTAGPVVRAVDAASQPASLQVNFDLDRSDRNEADRADDIILNSLHATLFAYEVEVMPSLKKATSCDSLNVAPLLRIQSLSTGDTQYYPAARSGATYRLMLHGVSPFMPIPTSAGASLPSAQHGLRFTLYLDNCQTIGSLRLTMNARASLGLLLSRYRTVIVAFPLAAISLVGSMAWEQWDNGNIFPDPLTNLLVQVRIALPIMLVISWTSIGLQKLGYRKWGSHTSTSTFNLAFGMPSLPLWFVVTLSVLFVLTAYGLSILVAFCLDVLVNVLSAVHRGLAIPNGSAVASSTTSATSQRSGKPTKIAIVALALLAIAIVTFIPIQFVFLVLFIVQIFICVRSTTAARTTGAVDMRNQQRLFLNLFFWLLPLNAPVLLVWSRNLLNRWFGTLGNADHNIFHIIGFLAIVYISAADEAIPRASSRLISTLTAILLLWVTISGLFYGIRYTYTLFSTGNFVCLWLAFLYVRSRLFSTKNDADAPNAVSLEDIGEEEREKREIESTLRFANVPSELLTDEATVVPPSIAQSMIPDDVAEPYIVEHSEAGSSLQKTSTLDVLLEEYLEVLDEYFSKRQQLSDAISGGVFQLSKARMQLGLPYMSRNWDARMKATKRVQLGTDNVLRLKEVMVIPQDKFEDGKDQDVAETTLRRRRAKGDNTDDDASKSNGKKETEESEKETDKGKEPAPYNPLYQFSALPPQTLRNAQISFNDALKIALGGESSDDDLVRTVSRLSRLEAAILAEKTKLAEAK